MFQCLKSREISGSRAAWDEKEMRGGAFHDTRK